MHICNPEWYSLEFDSNVRRALEQLWFAYINDLNTRWEYCQACELIAAAIADDAMLVVDKMCEYRYTFLRNVHLRTITIDRLLR